MTPGDIRTLALKAVGHTNDPAAVAAGKGELVDAIEAALLELRCLTVKEAVQLAGGPMTTIGYVLHQLLPEPPNG